MSSSHRRANPDRQQPSKPARKLSGAWKHGALPVIGLVGGIGAGKSTVASLLEEGGAHVLDADQIGHALLDQKPARESVVAAFGPEVLSKVEPESVDRAELGRRVFDDPGALRELERILHPRMRKTFEKSIARLQRRRQAKGVVLDAAILFEAGWNDLCDLIIFVDAPRPLRLSRVAASRGWDEAALARREAVQMPLESKRAQADVVILNVDDTDALRVEVDKLWALIRAQYRQRMLERPSRKPPSRP